VKTKTKSKLKIRNGHAFHPIMNKGGVHEKSTGAKRMQAKKKWKKDLDEWYDCSPYKLPCFPILFGLLTSLSV
jgi:hypothetical protein